MQLCCSRSPGLVTAALRPSDSGTKTPVPGLGRFADIALVSTAGLSYRCRLRRHGAGFVGADWAPPSGGCLDGCTWAFKRPAVLDLPGGGTIAAAAGVVVEAFYLNPKAAIDGLCYRPLVGLAGACCFVDDLGSAYHMSRRAQN